MDPLLHPSRSGYAAGCSFSWFRSLVAAFVLTPMAVLPPHVRAQLPTGAQITHGSVAIMQAGGQMTIDQTSRQAIVNWQSFNIGPENSLRLQQLGADSAMLARVTGGDPSKLLGSLQADGKLFLINPKGILVGAGATIDTAGFLGATLDVSDADFLRGSNLIFKGTSDAGIVNLGRISAREGNVLLFAHTVKNAGDISAAKGSAALAAGTEVHLAAADDPTFTIKLNLPATSEKTGVENTGVIAAAQARLEAAGGSIYDLAVNQSGVVRATGFETKNGRVLLTASGGTVGVNGDVSARNVDGSGGEILVGGDYQGANAAVPNSARTVVTATAKLDASADPAKSSAAAGRVIVWADDATRFLGTVDTRGAGGGFAEVSGKRWLDFSPSLPVQVGTGGTLLLDPDALVISSASNSGTSTSGSNPFVFGTTTEPATLNVTTLQNQLALSNVTLNTSTSGGDVTFNSAVNWSSNNTLRVQAGGSILINADITGGATSTLALYPGRITRSDIPGELGGGPDLMPRAELTSAATIRVGTLTYGANAASNVANHTVTTPAQTLAAFFDGRLVVNILEVDLSSGGAGVSAYHENNAIGAFRTTGTGDLTWANIYDHQGGLDITINSAASTAPRLTFLTPGTLTLKSGSSLNFSSASTIELISTGGAFVNQAGSTVFGAKVRHLIYTNTAAATTRGGLGGTYVFNRAYDPDDTTYFDDSISRIIYSSAQPTLTLTADAKSRFYGDANPALTVSATGLVDGDTLATATTGSVALMTSATQASNAGSYTINTAAGTLASSFYALSFANGALTVNKAPLTVTVSNSITKTQGTPNPDFAAFTSTSGLKLSDTLTTAVPDLAFSTTATTGSSSGVYPVSASGTSANYAPTFNAGQLTISSLVRPILTYAANNLSRLYGDANPTLTFTRSGFVSGVADDVTGVPALSTSASQASGVGSYTINIGQGTLASTNYQFAFTPAALTITKAPLTATINHASRAPNTANPAFTATYTGLKAGDTATTIASGLTYSTSATASSPSGVYPITGSGTLANYEVSFINGSLTIGGILNYIATSATRTYGAMNPTLGYTVGGLIPGDTLSNVVTGTPALSTTAVQNSGVGTYAINITQGTLASSSYGFAFTPGALTIERAPLTITANNASRTYGAANPAFDATYTGFVNGDTRSIISGLQLSTTATTASNVGTYAITTSGGTAANYTITHQPGALTINPALLSVSVNNASRAYGDANPAFSGNVTGLVNGDTAAGLGLTYSTTATAASSVNGGGYPITALFSGNSNYVLQSSTPGTLTITPAPLTVKMDDQTRRYGDADPALTHTVSGLKNGDSAASAIEVRFTGTTANANSGIGSYGILGTAFALSSNYSVGATQAGSLTITPRPLTITADNKTRVYGDENPAFTATYTGLAPFDTPSTLGALQFNTQANVSSGVGNFGITFANLVNRNYTITSVFGTLAITPAPITFGTLDDVWRFYGRADPTITFPSISGLKNNDTVTNLGLRLSGLPAATADVGRYTYTIAGSNSNYTYVGPVGTFRIDPAPLAVAITPTGRVYGDANPTSYEITARGLAFSDTAASVLSVSNPTDPRTDIGTYAVTPLLNNRNYAIESVTGGDFKILPRTLTFTAADLTRVYGDANPFLYGSVTGFANGDTQADVVSHLGYTTDADRSSNTGSYMIRPSALIGANYVAKFVLGTLTVTPAAATVTIANASRAFNQINPAFEVAGVQGLKNQDTVASLALVLSSAATQSSNVGTYPITGSSSSQNYALTFVPGTLTVNRANATIAGNTASRPFGDLFATADPLTATFNGFRAEDEALARSNWQLNFSDQATLAAGAHSIAFTQAQPSVASALGLNYNISVTPGTINVTPRPVTITGPSVATTIRDLSNPFTLIAPATPAGAPRFTVIGRADTGGKITGVFAIQPEIIPGEGVTREELDRYFAFDLRPGALTLTLPQDVVDLTTELDPSRLTTLNQNNTLNPNQPINNNSTITIKKEDTLTLTTSRDVALQTTPLTQKDFANYFASFDKEMGAVKASLAGSYSSFLAGAGKTGSGYENMAPAARALLAGWMNGSVTTDMLRAGIASGDAAAIEAFGFIMPSLVERTRDKDIAALTPLDRDVLGRLADLTEKRRSETVRIAQEKYEEMVAAQAKRAELNGAAVLFLGPGDFQNIVDRATEEAVGAYIGGTLAGASVTAGIPVLYIAAVSNAIFPHAATGAAAAGGPAVAAALAVVLAVRAVQVSESVKNEAAYNALISSYKLGTQITSIADLKSAAMDKEMKLSTLMLATDLLNPGR